MDIQKLTDICKDRNVWIQTHNFPDPDAIASAFGLQELLAHFNIKASLCHEGEIDKLSSIKMLTLLGIDLRPYREICSGMTAQDVIILVDCQKNSGNTTDLIGDELAVIDHHPTFVTVEYEYSDLRITGACASIIADYYRQLSIEPSVNAATALLYGLRMDTLQFSRGVTSFDIDMFAYLFKYADSKLLAELETNNMEFEDLHGYGTAIENIRIYGTIGFSHIDFECPDALVAILSDFLLSLVEVDVVVLYAKRPDGYKFSIRSERQDVNAGELANAGLSSWGSGGGHASMAGGFVPKEGLKVKDELFYNAVRSHFIQKIRELYPDVIK